MNADDVWQVLASSRSGRLQNGISSFKSPKTLCLTSRVRHWDFSH